MAKSPTQPRKPKAAPKLARLIEKYYVDLAAIQHQNVFQEMGTRNAFFALLSELGKQHGWTLIPEHEKKLNGRSVYPDATFKDDMYLVRGYWEAKDTNDDLDAEIAKKRKAGYPTSNMIFEDTQTAVLYQHNQEILRVDMKDPAKLAELLTEFFRYVEPEIEEFEVAVDEFKQRVPDLAEGLKKKIDQAHKSNKAFQKAFDDFFTLCRSSLNPNLSPAAVDEMLIQHILTERLIREIFDNPEFVRRNVIAAEVEKVMLAMTSQSFDRNTYLKELDRFYVAIEHAARTMTDFADKQHFLNTVYERFFQGYSVKLADTMGIVYTPQEIVDFMCASVEEVLDKEFGKKLWSDDVYIIDPCTGTGNFIVNLIRRIPKAKLDDVYKHRLFANEIMLLPYYIAALNTEHAYFEQTGRYEPFEGLCFVDTLDLAELAQKQLGFMTAANTQRVERQRRSPITVVIGNPPYNASQVDESQNNKNREYSAIDKRIKNTYVKLNSARKTKLYDPYVRFFRWASDRLGKRDGIVCFVSNNSFVHQTACDGLQKGLTKEFSRIIHLDLRGNVRENPTLSGTAYNVFGIQVGVGITIAVKNSRGESTSIDYHALPLELRRSEKLDSIRESQSVRNIEWARMAPDESLLWRRPSNKSEFDGMIPLGSKAAKASQREPEGVICHSYSLGLSTNRDTVAYAFSAERLMATIDGFAEAYNSELDKFRRRKDRNAPVNDIIDHERLKWSRNLKRHLQNGDELQSDPINVRRSLYRPFCPMSVYLADIVVDEMGQTPTYFPNSDSEAENWLVCVPTIGNRAKTYTPIASRLLPNLNLTSLDAFQCFPYYVYDEDGSNRRENITDWALNLFRDHYRDKKIDKWAIFHYVYGLLHHPAYREKFADNLKRELPRIPLAPPLPPQSGDSPGGASECSHGLQPVEAERRSAKAPEGRRKPAAPDAAPSSLASSGFWAFSNAGKKLANLHINYEKLDPYPLKFVEAKGEPLSYRVDDKMRLNKDKTALAVNKSLTLDGIPPDAFKYRLGNRSALEWVIDQYQVYTDPRSQITSDPNREDDPQYIVRLVGQVIRVSLDTMQIVNALPKEFTDVRSS